MSEHIVVRTHYISGVLGVRMVSSSEHDLQVHSRSLELKVRQNVETGVIWNT